MERITITVEGRPKSGKSFLCLTVARVLQELGYQVSVEDDDHGNIITEKIEKLKESGGKWPFNPESRPVIAVKTKLEHRALPRSEG